MRKLFAIALVALLLGVGVVAIIQTDPGYVLIAYGNYTLEASLWVGLIVLLIVGLVGFLLLRLVYQFISGQRSLVSWLGARKSRKARRLSTQGLISFIEGNWLTARRQLVSGAEHNEAPLMNYILAARSSAQLRDDDKVHEYFRAASDAEPDAATAVGIALAELQLQAGEYQRALATLDHATSSPARHPYVLDLLRRAYLGLQDWDKLLDILPQLQKQKLLSREELQHLEYEVHTQRLERGHANIEQLRGNWRSVPKRLQTNAVLVAAYARSLVQLGDHSGAEKAIVRVLKREWHVPLIQLYGLVEGDTGRQLSRAESWLKEHPQEPQLLLCLGRLSARAEQWDKAREYMESAYRLEHSAQICAELGRLLDGLGEPSIAAAYFREGLLLQESSLPALPAPPKTAPDTPA